MRYEDQVRGAGGGGGKDGGGSSHVPTEAPDSLRSKQYARVVDLISEGEIVGLVDGLKSVYLDDTPLMNPDGSYNFSGVTIDTRNGTQDQPYIPGFGAIESETAVGAEIKNGTAVVRTITNENADAVRVTISIPQLTYQDTQTGDLVGSAVQIAIDVQTNGGGFVPVPLRRIMDASQIVVNGASAYSKSASNHFTLDVNWAGTTDLTLQASTVQLQYRIYGSGGAWTTYQNLTFSGRANRVTTPPTTSGLTGNAITDYSWYTTSSMAAPTGMTAIDVQLPSAQYEFRLVLSGSGSAFFYSGKAEVADNTDTISGKTTSKYQRSYRIPLSGAGPWDIRVSRITGDSTQVNLVNKTFWDSFTEIIDAKMRYPNSAVVALQIDASQFRSVPRRGYRIKGIKVHIPNNYDPLIRQYSGVWNGTFTVAWTDNPAWVFYDIITNDRYGLGDFIDANQVDKWALYSIAQYCDELVSDGFGGLVPRFTCNLYLQTREEAFKVVSNIASIFRAFAYWSQGAITAVQDRPSDPVAIYSPANVIDGSFSYQGTSRRARHTVALVTWNDPADMYRQKVEYVPDREGISRYGIVQLETIAIGCASRGQAHRMGKWMLITERLETETVTFRAGMDSAFRRPGSVIQTQDPNRSGKRFGGRIMAATTSAITLDAPVTIEAGKTYSLSCVLPDGSIETHAVTNAAGDADTLNVDVNFSVAPQLGAMWLLSASDLVPENWRVLSVTEVDPVTYEITAMTYNQGKFDLVEKDLVLEPAPTTALRTNPSAVTNLTLTESLTLVGIGLVGVKASLSWTPVYNANRYLVTYQELPSGSLKQIETADSTVDIAPIVEGIYEFYVVAINGIGRRSQATSIQAEILGKTLPPADVSNFQMAAISGMACLTFNAAPDLDVIVGGNLRIKHTANLVGADWKAAVDIGPALPGNATSATLPLLAGTYLAKWVDSSGNESVNAIAITTTAPNVLGTNIVETITENPSWSGTKTNVVIDPVMGGLKLSGVTLIDDMTDLIDSWDYIDSLGGIVTSGEYISPTTVDLGAVMTSRLTASLAAFGFDANDLIDLRGLVDSWSDVDGGLITDVSSQIHVRTTNDDPAGSPIWSGWQPFFVGDWAARALQFKVVLNSNFATHNVTVTGMSVTVDMPDRIESFNNLTSGTGIYHVAYSTPFKAVKGRGITAENMASGDYYVISNETTSGFDITFYNSIGAVISRTFDVTTVGYGHG
jgi:predicted phage tail protein